MTKIFKQQQQPSNGWSQLPMQQQASWVAVGVTVVGAVGGAVGGAQQKKAAEKAAAAGKGTAVDIASLDQQARDLSKRNIADSIALENRFAPEVAALRQQATSSLLPYTGTNNPLSTTGQQLRTSLYGDFANAGTNTLQRSSLLDETVNRARADLALGGQLDTSTRNEISRRAAANAGSVGGGGLQLGRDLSARDLGLSSNALLQSRLTNAAAIGAQDQAFNNAAAQFGMQNTAQRLSTAGLISDLGQQDFNRQFQLAQFGQGIARPETGLDPTSLVNLTVGNQNASNAAAQNAAAVQAQSGNALMGLGGNLVGAGVGLYGNQQRAGAATNTAPQASKIPSTSSGNWGYIA